MIHRWSAFGRPDHGGNEVKLEDDLGTLAQTVLGSLGSQGAAADVSALCGWADRAGVMVRVFQPMAERLAPGDYRSQLHHFVSAGVWDAVPLETELLIQADRLVGGSDAVLVIDDTAVPKKGTHSVG